MPCTPHCSTATEKFIILRLAAPYEAIYMDVLSVAASRTRPCLLSTGGALMAPRAAFSKYLYACTSNGASSKRSLLDLGTGHRHFRPLLLGKPFQWDDGVTSARTNHPLFSAPFLFCPPTFHHLRIHFPSPVISRIHACRRNFLRALRFPPPTMQTSRLGPIYISISWMAGFAPINLVTLLL